MTIFGKLFAGAKRPSNQAVLVYLDGTSLPDAVYEEYDVATIEDRLSQALAHDGTGEFDGNEIGPGEVTLFMYGQMRRGSIRPSSLCCGHIRCAKVPVWSSERESLARPNAS